MARTAPVALVAALLAATAVAFVVTERLKLTPSPILGVSVPAKVFSPVCECDTDVAVIRIRLRRADTVSLQIVDRKKQLVRDLVIDAPKRRGWAEFYWNGRYDSESVVPDGVYRPRIHLARERRTIVMPNPIRVDTTPPTLKLVSLAPRRISPDGDGRRERMAVRYKVDEPARAGLYVNGERVVLRRGQQAEGKIEWNGREGGAGVPSGAYRVSVVPTDVAGNVGRAARAGVVYVRYISLGRKRIETRPGARIDVLVRTDAASYTWRLGRRTGVAKPGTLTLRAPLQPGRFTLTVSANGRDTRAAVFVRRPPAGP